VSTAQYAELGLAGTVIHNTLDIALVTMKTTAMAKTHIDLLRASKTKRAGSLYESITLDAG
jgi:hypothetical protein